MLDLLALQSGVVTRTRGIVTLVVTRRMEFPAPMHERLLASIRSRLFRLEQALGPTEIVLLHRVVDQISGLAERSQAVGLRLQVMLSH